MSKSAVRFVSLHWKVLLAVLLFLLLLVGVWLYFEWRLRLLR